jgi:hypothetical protein
MTPDIIEKFIEDSGRKSVIVNVHFKERSTISGVFVRGEDYEELKRKNFWRIVSETNMSDWKETKNINLARLYNGAAFTKLSDYKN